MINNADRLLQQNTRARHSSAASTVACWLKAGCPVATCCSGHTMFDNTILAANKEGRRALTLLMTFPSLRIVEMAARGDSPSLGPPRCPPRTLGRSPPGR